MGFERDLWDGWKAEVQPDGALLWTPGGTIAGWMENGDFETGDYVLRVPATVLLKFLNAVTAETRVEEDLEF